MAAQTIDSNYVDGAIYVKIFNHENETLPTFDQNSSSGNLGNFQDAITAFQINKIYQPFDFITFDSVVQKIYRVEFSDYTKVEKVINYFQSYSYVEVAEKISLNQISCTNDPTLGNPPIALNINNYHFHAIRATFGCTFSSGATSTPTIGIVDNELDVNHEDLVNQIWLYYDVSDQDGNVLGPASFSHGTKVAGIIGAEGNNNKGTVGVGYKSQMIFAKASSDNGPATKITHGYEGIAWCIEKGANIINCSWGNVIAPGVVESLILDMAENRRIVVVGAAGNLDNIQPGEKVYPAAYPTVLSVASTQSDVNNASSNGKVLQGNGLAINLGSNYNVIGSAATNWIDVSAPGTSIYTTISSATIPNSSPPSNTYNTTASMPASGTSMACALTSGLCGVLMKNFTANDYLTTPAQHIRDCIISTADDINSYNASLNGGVPPLIDMYDAAACITNNSPNFANWTVVPGYPNGGCAGSSIDFFDYSTLSSPATNYSWIFQGATAGTSTSSVQYPTGVTYNIPGNYDVTLNVTNTFGTFTKYSPNAISIVGLQTDLVSINNGSSSQPALTSYCDGSEVALKLTPLGGYPPYTVQYQITGQPNIQTVTFNGGWQNIFFEASTNGLDIWQIEAHDFNGLPITCALNQHINVNVVNCCDNSIVNGNFEQGFTGFTSDYCHWPNSFGVGHFTVSDVVLPNINNTVWPSVREFFPNKNNSMYIQSSYLVGTPGVTHNCPNGQLTYPSGPPPANSCGDASLSPKHIWKQTVSLDNNSDYRFSFLVSKNVDFFGIPGTYTVQGVIEPQFRFEIFDGTNVVYICSPLNQSGSVPVGATPNRWVQYMAGIPSGTLPSNGQYEIRIVQFFNFCDIRYLIDDIVLQKEGQEFTISASSGCVNSSGTVTITALPSTLSYTFSGPGVVSSTGNTAIVNQAGAVTVNCTSPNVCTAIKDLYIGDCANCPQAPTTATWFGNPTVSTDIPSGNLPSGAVVIDGTLTVDQTLAISNNPDVFFTPNAIANVGASSSLLINQSQLQGCANLWDGIVAPTNNSNISISNSIVKNMLSGIRVSGGASIDAQNNDFEDNQIAIQLSDLITPPNTVIDNNNFNTISTNLLPPLQTQTHGYYAVGITNCKDFNLTGNRIEKFKTGIHIYQDDPGLGISTHNTTGNTFKDIKGVYGTAMTFPYNQSYVYTPPNGVALAITNNTSHDSKLIHNGNTLTNNTIDFDDCSKGIFAENVSVDISSNDMDNNMGSCINISRPENHIITVANNNLNDTYMGVLLQGNPSVGTISQNTITLLPALGIALSPVATPYTNNIPSISYGISLSGYTYNQVIDVDIIGNTISTQDNESAIGINLRNAREGNCDGNTILFNSTTSYTGSYPLPSLIGINMSNTNHVHMRDNNVKAAGSSNSPTVTDNPSTGVYMWRSERPHMDCNIFDYTQYGMYVVGRNPIPSHNITNNRFANLKAGLLFRHLVTEGTVGDIGAPNSDRDNKLTLVGGTPSSPAPYWRGKIYRIPGICAGASVPNDAIYTQQSTLDGTNDPYASRISDPTVPQCLVDIDNQPTAADVAPGCSLGPNPAIPVGDDGVVDPNYAEDVVDGDVEYVMYPEGGEYMDAHDLYAQLEQDPDILTERPILDSFYLSYQQEAMAGLYEVDMMIAELCDPAMDRNSVAFTNLLASTIAFNNQLITDEGFESNERLINSYYLDMLTEDWTAFDSVQVDQILRMAADCPYLGGFGVNKARTLAAAYLPHAHYDDLWICNNMGVYKTSGKSRFDIENEDLNSLTQPLSLVEKDGGYNVYPNPTNGIVNISYEGSVEATDATFTLYDMLGKQVFAHKIYGFYNSLNLPPLASGLYTYIIRTDAITEKQGKLLLEK